MDEKRFDQFTRLTASRSRRGIVKGLIGLAFGSGIVAVQGGDADAASCRGAGTSCREHANCCSHYCGADGRGRRVCQCQAGFKACRGQCILTDSCCESAECQTTNDPCLSVTCDRTTNQCEQSINVGRPCGEDTLCTSNLVCQDDGTCAGTEKDCSFLDDDCNQGVCNPSTGACEQQPANQFEFCEDNNACTNATYCVDGACIPTSTVQCQQSSDPCLENVCNPATGQCESQPTNVGGECPSGSECLAGTCSANGTCETTPTNMSGACNPTNVCATGTCDPNGVCQENLDFSKNGQLCTGCASPPCRCCNRGCIGQFDNCAV